MGVEKGRQNTKCVIKDFEAALPEEKKKNDSDNRYK